MNAIIKIRKTKINGRYTYVVPAMYYAQNNQQIAIPSPFGKELLEFDTLKEAQDAIHYAGYESELAEMPTPSSTTIRTKKYTQKTDYSKIIDIFIANLGDENLNVRNASIDALAKFGDEIADQLIEALSSENWLIKYSTILCIDKIAEKNPDTSEIFINPIISAANDKNNMVKSAAITALSKLCHQN